MFGLLSFKRKCLVLQALTEMFGLRRLKLKCLVWENLN